VQRRGSVLIHFEKVLGEMEERQQTRSRSRRMIHPRIRVGWVVVESVPACQIQTGTRDAERDTVPLGLTSFADAIGKVQYYSKHRNKFTVSVNTLIRDSRYLCFPLKVKSEDKFSATSLTLTDEESPMAIQSILQYEASSFGT